MKPIRFFEPEVPYSTGYRCCCPFHMCWNWTWEDAEGEFNMCMGCAAYCGEYAEPPLNIRQTLIHHEHPLGRMGGGKKYVSRNTIIQEGDHLFTRDYKMYGCQ